MTDKYLHHHCMMCQTIEVQGIRMSLDSYYKAGGGKEAVTSGICEENTCINSYILFSSGGDEGLAKIIKKELSK